MGNRLKKDKSLSGTDQNAMWEQAHNDLETKDTLRTRAQLLENTQVKKWTGSKLLNACTTTHLHNNVMHHIIYVTFMFECLEVSLTLQSNP